jgi:hypothetical protein
MFAFTYGHLDEAGFRKVVIVLLFASGIALVAQSRLRRRHTCSLQRMIAMRRIGDEPIALCGLLSLRLSNAKIGKRSMDEYDGFA